MSQLRIGEVAAAVGTTPRTIRYYEEIGLLAAASERPAGSHRLYGQAEVERLRELLRMKEVLGVSLDELRELVAAEEPAPRSSASTTRSTTRSAAARSPRRRSASSTASSSSSRRRRDEVDAPGGRAERAPRARDEAAARDEGRRRARSRSARLRTGSTRAWGELGSAGATLASS